MLSKLSLATATWPNDEYLLFSIDPFHLFHFGILKTMNEGIVEFLAASERHTDSSESK